MGHMDGQGGLSMVHCPDCGSFNFSSEMQYGQALCTCAKCGCQWWDDSEEQERDKEREREDREIQAIAEMAEDEFIESRWRN